MSNPERYISVLKRLYQTNRFKSKKVNLDNLFKATTLFNNPQDKMNFIHVTGTNGKGSVCKKLSTIFEKSGYKTGLYISPHISTFRERIQINSILIEKSYIIDQLESIYKIIDKIGLDLTFFEIVTLLSLLYFKDSKVDIGIIEVGLGGNLDATNIIDPLLSVITSIGLDHTDSLGFTLSEIAEKKAGIIKDNRPVVLGPDCCPLDIFVNKAKETKSELFIVEYNKKFDLDFDNENKEIANKCIDIINNKYSNLFKISKEAVLFGLNSKQPCRKENILDNISNDILRKNLLHLFSKNMRELQKFYSDEQISMIEKKLDSNFPERIYLDVGHNPHGLEKLLSSIQNEFPSSNLNVICGFSAHKDIGENIRTICSFAKRVYLVTSKHPRVLPFTDLKELVIDSALYNYQYDQNILVDNNWTKGAVNLNILHSIVNAIFSKNKEIIVICGSFFIMNEARLTLGYMDEEDPGRVELNELNGSVKFKI